MNLTSLENRLRKIEPSGSAQAPRLVFQVIEHEDGRREPPNVEELMAEAIRSGRVRSREEIGLVWFTIVSPKPLGERLADRPPAGPRPTRRMPSMPVPDLDDTDELRSRVEALNAEIDAMRSSAPEPQPELAKPSGREMRMRRSMFASTSTAGEMFLGGGRRGH